MEKKITSKRMAFTTVEPGDIIFDISYGFYQILECMHDGVYVISQDGSEERRMTYTDLVNKYLIRR